VKVLKRQYAAPASASQFKCQFPIPPIPETNISDYLMDDFEQRGELPALICGASGKEISFAGMKSLSRKFGSGLLNLGLKEGDKVAVVAPNCPEYGPVLFGSLGVAVTVVPISPLFTAPEIARVLKMAEPKLIVTIDPLVPLVLAAQDQSDRVLPMVTMSDNPTSSAIPFEQFTDNNGTDYDKRPLVDPHTSVAVLLDKSPTDDSTQPRKRPVSASDGLECESFNIGGCSRTSLAVPVHVAPPISQGKQPLPLTLT